MDKIFRISFIFICLMNLSLASEEKKSLKKEINETANQIDSGVRKAIKEVKTLIKPKEKKT